VTEPEASPDAAAPRAGGLRLALLLAVLGSGVLLVALGRTWAEAEGVSGLTIGTLVDRVSGQDLARGAQACAYASLAAGVALIALRGWGRVVIGVLLVGVAVGALVDLAPLLTSSGLTDRAQEVLSRCDDTGCSAQGTLPPRASGWPWVASAGALLVLLAGGLTVWRGRAWAGLGSSYDAPGAAPEPAVTDKAVWDALDRGDDPTT
jgi:uncharacterized membrane protein (TIGR02234 family)